MEHFIVAFIAVYIEDGINENRLACLIDYSKT